MQSTCRSARPCRSDKWLTRKGFEKQESGRIHGRQRACQQVVRCQPTTNQSRSQSQERTEVCRTFAQGSAQKRGKPGQESATGHNEMLRTTRRSRLLPAGSNPGSDPRVGWKHFCHRTSARRSTESTDRCTQFQQFCPPIMTA